MPNVNISPTTSKATRRYLIRSDSVMCPSLAIQLIYRTWVTSSRDHSLKAESRRMRFSEKCDLMRVQKSKLGWNYDAVGVQHGLRWANNLDCGRTSWRWSTLRRARGRKTDCFSRTRIGNSRGLAFRKSDNL